MAKILILGAYGQSNIGDDALLEAIVAQFPHDELTVNSARPDATASRYGITAIPTYAAVPQLRYLSAVMRADQIVFGGGSLLKEVEGGWLAQLAYSLRLLGMLLLARLLGKSTAMLGIGVGPLRQRFSRRVARLAAGLTDQITVRDHDSLTLLRAIGVQKPVQLVADPVFTLAALSRQPPHGQPIVTVVPRYSLTPAACAALAAACDLLVARYHVRIVLLPFQTGYARRYDDNQAAEAIRTQMQFAASAIVIVPTGSAEARALIAQSEFVISARLHALIFAAQAGVAALALDYEPKVGSFMAEVDQRAACVALEDITRAAFLDRVASAWQGRAEAASTLRAALPQLQTRAHAAFMLLRSLPTTGDRTLLWGLLFFVSTTVVNLGNYGFNLVLGRWLGPAAFADLSLTITLLLMLSFLSSALSMVTAKYAAGHVADIPQIAGLRRWLAGWAWAAGALLGLGMVGGAPQLAAFFQTASPLPFVLLGLGVPLYLAQAVDRGILQGQTRFGALALSYQTEMWVRLGIALLLVAIGWGTLGALVGLLLSIVGAWAIARVALRGLPAATLPSTETRRAAVRFAAPTLLALLGQILINNSDVLLVKHLFSAAEAGAYAALALIGRVVFFATWSVVTVAFPIVAQRQQRGLPHRQLLWLSLALVMLIAGPLLALIAFAPELTVQLLFGSAYLSIAPLLLGYALATTLYALANVVVSYRLSAGDGGGSLLMLAASVAQVGLLLIWHATLAQVVQVQIAVMAALLLATFGWDGWLRLRGQRCAAPTPDALGQDVVV